MENTKISRQQITYNIFRTFFNEEVALDLVRVG